MAAVAAKSGEEGVRDGVTWATCSNPPAEFRDLEKADSRNGKDENETKGIRIESRHRVSPSNLASNPHPVSLAVS